MTVNFGRAADDYAKYRDPLPDALFDQLAERGIEWKGKSVVDLGSGTGLFTRQLASRGARVTGIEPSLALIGQAVRSDRRYGIDSIQYVNAYAEDFALPGRYPLFTAVRAWHWFDRVRVIRNLIAHCEPGGHAVVINSVFLPDSEAAQATFEIVRSHRIAIGPAGSYAETKERRCGFPVPWFAEWESHSLRVAGEWEHRYTLPFTHEEWCGKIRSVSWMTAADDETRRSVTGSLLRRLSTLDPILHVPHKYSVVVLRYEGSAG